jgi:hypothetical protein
MRRDPDSGATINPAVEITGTVVVAGGTVPLGGTRVRWMAEKSSGKAPRSNRPAIELGTATTAGDGSFTITISSEAAAKETYCLMQCGSTIRSSLVAEDKSGAISQPLKLSADVREITLAVKGTTAPGRQPLRSLARYLETNRRLLTRDLAAELVNPSPDSPARNMEAGVRASGIRALLQVIAKEYAETTASLDSLYKNNFISTAALADGNLKKAASYYLDTRRVIKELGEGAFFRPGLVFPPMSKSDAALYRDYLRGVWVTAAQKMYWDDASFTTAPATTLEKQLDSRLHQDFHVADDIAQPASQLLIDLLLSVLTAPANREGAGLAPAAIPAQGGQSNDDYLALLISLSKKSPQELKNRFRVSFDRAPGETLSPIQLNVEALLGLLADTFQCPEEPFAATPVIVEGKPLVFGDYAGHAPFFLEYEEWLARQGTFYPENVFDIRRTVPALSDDYRTSIKSNDAWHVTNFPGEGYFDDPGDDRAKAAGWIEKLFPIVDSLNAATALIDGQNYPEAQQKLTDTDTLIRNAIFAYSSTWFRDKFYWLWSGGTWNDDRKVSLNDRAKLAVTSVDQLTSFEAFFDAPYYPTWTGQPDGLDESREKGIAKARTLFIYALFYYECVLLPYLRASICTANGDYANAIKLLVNLTGYQVGIADTPKAAGYDLKSTGAFNYPNLYQDQTLPYTTAVGFDQDKLYRDMPASFMSYENWLAGTINRVAIAPFEQRFFELAQGDAMLCWADQLYRNDDPSSIRRARELYKGVILMHDEDPHIAPNFDPHRQLLLPGIPIGLKLAQQNPAKVSQVTRAQLGFYQIEQGLNAYGYCGDMVPVLRYKPLKQNADFFASSAKAAENDFLQYMTRYEEAQIDMWQAQDLVKRAQASAGIASEQIAIAQDGVTKAQAQVKAVQDQIAAKQKEIADKDSFFSQASDYFSGIKDSLTALVPLAQKVAADDSPAGVASGDDLLGILEKGVSGGGSAAQDAATATLGSGAAMVIGFGAFVYTSYSSMQSMADAANKRSGDLNSLENVALPAAQAQVRLKQRDVSIAQYQQQIAQADLEYANHLWRFQQERFLNAEFWNRLSRFSNQLMRSYIDLGARIGWQAERALAFEQNRDIRILRMNYFPNVTRGVMGPDQLQADLAQLEATRLQGARLTTPVKHTISLARDFPIAFAQLKKSGTCRFRADESVLRIAYPGTYGYRIRAVTAAAYNPGGVPPRGILRNPGVSIVASDDAGSANTLVRFPDALALSEFRLHDDLFVYGLPGETLMQFEGSGFSTDWELDFLPAANPQGLRSLADILLTLDMNASYSDSVTQTVAATPPSPTNRAIAAASSIWDPSGLKSLKGTAATAKMTFDLTRLALPAQEKNRTISNLAVLCVGNTQKNYAAKLSAPKSGKTASVIIEQGVALSNSGPLLGTAAPLPLNALVGLTLDQAFVLEINRTAATSSELSKLFDVVLYLDYSATV